MKQYDNLSNVDEVRDPPDLLRDVSCLDIHIRSTVLTGSHLCIEREQHCICFWMSEDIVPISHASAQVG